MSIYNWNEVGQDEGSIAGGRLADQVRNRIGASAYSIQAARDAALAELLAGTAAVVNVKGLGGKNDGSADIAPALAAAGVLGVGRVALDEGTFLLSAASLTDLGLDGGGQSSLITTDTSAGDDLITFVRGSSGRFRQARNFAINVSTDLAAAIRIEYPRFLLDNVRISALEGAAVSDALVRLESAWIVTLLNVYLTSTDTAVGLRLGTSANAVDIIGGEYATAGDAIVIDGGSRVRVQTTIESEGDGGLVINAGNNIHVATYFELRGIEINGGNRITIADSYFVGADGTVVIDGGTSIVFDGAYWATEDAPRAAVTVAADMDHEVFFRQSTSFGTDGTKHVLASSIVDGEHVGANLLTDPYFDEWTSDTPDNYSVTNSGASVAVTHETTTFQTGTGGLRCDINEATTSARGIDISLSGILDDVKGHWATVSGWLYLPVVTDSGANYRVRLVSTAAATDQQDFSVAAFAAVADAWVFFSHSLFVETTATDLDIEIRALGTKVVGEYFIIDRLAVTRGKTSQNVPVRI